VSVFCLVSGLDDLTSNLGTRRGYNFALVVTFESKESEAKYQTHEEHVRAKKECIAPHLSKEADPVLALDYVDLAAPSSKV